MIYVIHWLYTICYVLLDTCVDGRARVHIIMIIFYYNTVSYHIMSVNAPCLYFCNTLPTINSI